MDLKPFNIEIVGDTVEAGDWVAWVRLDEHTDCSSALSGASTVVAGLAYNGGDGRIFVDVTLDGDKDGISDPDPYNNVQELGSGGEEHPSSTYTMCHASARLNNQTYTAGLGLGLNATKEMSLGWVTEGELSSTSQVRASLLPGSTTNQAVSEAWEAIPHRHRAAIEAILRAATMDASKIARAAALGFLLGLTEDSSGEEDELETATPPNAGSPDGAAGDHDQGGDQEGEADRPDSAGGSPDSPVSDQEDETPVVDVADSPDGMDTGVRRLEAFSPRNTSQLLQLAPADLSNCTSNADLGQYGLSFTLPDTQDAEEHANYVRAILEAATQPSNSSNLSACTTVHVSESFTEAPVGPQSTSDFVYFPGVKLYTQHAPPSPPPPSPPPPLEPPSPPPPPSAPMPVLPIDAIPPYITAASLNGTILLVEFSEPVFPHPSTFAPALEGDHLNVVLSGVGRDSVQTLTPGLQPIAPLGFNQ